MKHTIEEYLNASCGIGKYYRSETRLLKQLKKTKTNVWAGFDVRDLIIKIEDRLSKLGIHTEEAA